MAKILAGQLKLKAVKGWEKERDKKLAHQDQDLNLYPPAGLQETWHPSYMHVRGFSTIYDLENKRWNFLICPSSMVSYSVIVVDTGYASIHHSKYWMPIYYDTIEDGQIRKSHPQLELCYFCIFISGINCQKYYYLILLPSFK